MSGIPPSGSVAQIFSKNILKQGFAEGGKGLKGGSIEENDRA